MTSVTSPYALGGTRASPHAVAKWGVLELFLLTQSLAPALLYIPGTQPLRILIRTLPFGLSLTALGYVFFMNRQPVRRFHPAAPFLLPAILYLAIQIFRPSTSSTLAGFAQVSLYLAVLAPVLWVPSFVRSEVQVARVLKMLFFVSSINASVGILQVWDPDRWLPAEYSTIVMSQGGPLQYVGADGRAIVRPPGLSDNPGAVCGPATVAALLGMIYALSTRHLPLAVLYFACSALGAWVVYLTHVRTNLLILLGMFAVYAIILALQGRLGRALTFAGSAIASAVLGLVLALQIGGPAVSERFLTLLDGSATDVYYASARGTQLQYDSMRFIEEHPLGAGLARWGMMRLYFGDATNLESSPIWAELQIPAWLLDGGLILVVLYLCAVVIHVTLEWRLLSRFHRLEWGKQVGVIACLNAGTVALIFGFTPFTNQVGMMFWYLAGLVYGLQQSSRRQVATEVAHHRR